MSDTEFDIIKKYFNLPSRRNDVFLANGDDCAAVSVSADKKLLVTTDTLIWGVHFPEKTDARDVAYKALMVNLSDLASMGAEPAWVTLAISLPEINHEWLQAFSTQFAELLKVYGIDLVGGDTTRGPLSITIQAMGLATDENLMKRSGAAVGDNIYVTGCPGAAAVGLQAILNHVNTGRFASCIERLNRPLPPVKFAPKLAEYCRCAIDISDGLIADLQHITEASSVGAVLDLSCLPVLPEMVDYFNSYNNGIIDWSLILSGGDDYELCFTAAAEIDDVIRELANEFDIKLAQIGRVTQGDSIRCYDGAGRELEMKTLGYQHFSMDN